jgi:hypothetical protein
VYRVWVVVLVADAVIREGKMVLVLFAVPLGIVTVYCGPTVDTKMEMETTVWVSVGVVV